MKDAVENPKGLGKFEHPEITAKGDKRATVSFRNPETLWFNTGTLCNIECVNCYIESSPSNDRLVYITADEVSSYLDQLVAQNWNVREIAFTGGEPFMNPQMIEMIEVSLAEGYDVLVLTNAMRPMMRPNMQDGLKRLNAAYPGKLTLRISLDHWSRRHHDQERGSGAYEKTLAGMRWIADAGITMTVAGRATWHIPHAQTHRFHAKS
ncbi:MAG: radical SAM protein, partial [Pseudomonadota bacterium]